MPFCLSVQSTLSGFFITHYKDGLMGYDCCRSQKPTCNGYSPRQCDFLRLCRQCKEYNTRKRNNSAKLYVSFEPLAPYSYRVLSNPLKKAHQTNRLHSRHSSAEVNYFAKPALVEPLPLISSDKP